MGSSKNAEVTSRHVQDKQGTHPQEERWTGGEDRRSSHRRARDPGARKASLAEEKPCTGAKAKTQVGRKQPGGGAPDHRLGDRRRSRPAERPFGRRDRRAYQGDRPRHQQSSRILFAAMVEKARPRQERGWDVGAAEGPLSASSLMMESLMACGRGLTIRQGKEHNAAWAAICVSKKSSFSTRR